MLKFGVSLLFTAPPDAGVCKTFSVDPSCIIQMSYTFTSSTLSGRSVRIISSSPSSSMSTFSASMGVWAVRCDTTEAVRSPFEIGFKLSLWLEDWRSELTSADYSFESSSISTFCSLDSSSLLMTSSCFCYSSSFIFSCFDRRLIMIYKFKIIKIFSIWKFKIN